MGQSIRRFMKVGIIFHTFYPQLGGGEGPILECLGRICGGDYFEAVEVARMKDGQVRKKAAEMIRTTHMVSAYGDQSRTLSAGLNINDLSETRRVVAVDILEEGIDGACEMGCAGFSFLCGRYNEGRKRQALEQLLKSARRLCGYAGEEGSTPICCEVFDYDIDKRAFIDPAAPAARYTGEVRRDYENFSLLVDLSHIPMFREIIEESILPMEDYITRAHMGDAIIKSPDREVCRDNHPGLGFPDSENDVEELAHYLRTPMEVGFLGEKKRPIVSFEVKSWKGESPEVVITNAKHTLNLAWGLVRQAPAFDIYEYMLSKCN